MTSEIRTNSLTSRAGLSTVTLTDSGPMFSGITTFVDNSTFSVGTGGTIHAPATNVMALGTNNIDAIKIDSSGNVNVTGILTASSISGGVSLTNGSNNRVVTATGAATLTGEANLTWDGTTLLANKGSGVGYIASKGGTSGGDYGIVQVQSGSTVRGRLVSDAAVDAFRIDTAGGASTPISFHTGSSYSEKLRITSGGQIRLPVNGQQLTWGASQQMQFYYESSEERMYLKGDGAYGFAFRVNGGNRIEIQKTTGDVIMQGSGGKNFQWDNSAADLYLTDSGSGASSKLKIGTSGDLQLYHDVGGANHIVCASNQELKLSANQFSFYDYTGVTMRAKLTSSGTFNIGGSSQTTHMLHLYSQGDAGIHIQADANNSGENDNPYLSMSQDGAGAAQFQIGMNGDAGQHFTTSLANAAYIYASNSSSQPIQIAHMNNMCVNIAARKNEIALNDYNGNTIAGMEIHHYGNDTGAALKFSGHNNTGTPGVKTFTQMTHLGGDAQFEIHHMGSRAINIGSTRRIRLPGIVGVAGSGLQTVYVESDGNLCTTSSLRQYKTNITTISDTSWLFKLNPVTFNWKKKTEVDGENVWEDTADDNGTQYGLIAEEVEAVKKDFCSYDNNNKLTGVHYDRIIAPLIKAVQDLKSEINNLQQENIALRARVTNLEGE